MNVSPALVPFLPLTKSQSSGRPEVKHMIRASHVAVHETDRQGDTMTQGIPIHTEEVRYGNGVGLSPTQDRTTMLSMRIEMLSEIPSAINHGTHQENRHGVQRASLILHRAGRGLQASAMNLGATLAFVGGVDEDEDEDGEMTVEIERGMSRGITGIGEMIGRRLFVTSGVGIEIGEDGITSEDADHLQYQAELDRQCMALEIHYQL